MFQSEFVYQNVHWQNGQDYGTPLKGAQEGINIREQSLHINTLYRLQPALPLPNTLVGGEFLKYRMKIN